MRAAFVTEDVLRAEAGGAGVLEALAAGGLTPVVLLPRPPAEALGPELAPYRNVACPPGAADCWGETPELLLDAAAEAGVAVGEGFLVCREAADVARGVAAGCRPVLVLATRTLDDVFGPDEPAHKEVATAPDLATAARYMLEEASHEARLGPFAYAPHPVLDEVPRGAAPSGGDLAKLFAVLTVAAVAVALGIAYLLQEIYQNFRFPAVSYWLTLQFIPQALRGTLFIVIGVGIGLMVPRLIGGMRARRSYRR
jgi:hypothetical protein